MLDNFSERAQKTLGQLELGIKRPKEQDRNFHKGGRSFYFFDFDDNVLNLLTPIVLTRSPGAPKELPNEVSITSAEFAKNHAFIGISGKFENYFIDYSDERGSFRNFRDSQLLEIERLSERSLGFEKDFLEAISAPPHIWKGPSWDCFYHAVFNNRPLSVITARGHAPNTIRRGIALLNKYGHIPSLPNYLSIYPVNHPDTRKALGHSDSASVPEIKKSAIRTSVQEALRTYGYNPHHRFGMSDDDPKNIELILEAMSELKKDYPEMSFFVFDTKEGGFIKNEVFLDCIKKNEYPFVEQLNLL